VERSSLAFIVEESGFLLTTYQSLTMPSTGALLPRIEVSLEVGDTIQSFRAEVIGVEPTLNFAVLKIHQAGAFTVSNILRDRNLTLGDEIYAATEGNVVAQHLVSGALLSLNSKECYQESLTAAMYLSDIKIPESGLGGPVFDVTGSVLGMYTGYHPPEQEGEGALVKTELTHILPIFLAFNIYDSIKQRQSLASPWTGFSVRPLTAEEQTQFPVGQGQYTGGIALEYIWEDSPAESMGLQVGDILVRFAYYPIHSPADFQKWLYMYGVGRSVQLFILREGKVLSKEYTIEERPQWADPR
jgi:S1-C subfamily serine protease